jgi:hypothetical protein
MKLIGLLSFYDEAPSWLSAAIASHHPAGLTHLVVCDGAYELFPDGRARSGIEQYDAINATCEGLGHQRHDPHPDRRSGRATRSRSAASCSSSA